MTASSDKLLSRAEVDRSGNVLRATNPEIHSVRADGHLSAGDLTIGSLMTASYSISDEDESKAKTIGDALRSVLMYREGNSIAMQIVHRELVEASVDLDSAVASRHKRMQAILDKLRRFPQMRLSQMSDIAGCRIVVPSLLEVEALQFGLGRAYEVHDVDDYIAMPKRSGYRAVHMILAIAGTNRVMREGSRTTLVEVQLRTTRQNEWADQIESATGTTGFDLKGGDPSDLPEDLVEYVKVASDLRALADQREPVDTDLESRLSELRELVRHYFQKR